MISRTEIFLESHPGAFDGVCLYVFNELRSLLDNQQVGSAASFTPQRGNRP